MADPTKAGQRLDSRYDENTPHVPDDTYANTLFDMKAIQANEAQKAGPRAEFKVYTPNGADATNHPLGVGQSANRNPRWK
jgi:hypothetical protein